MSPRILFYICCIVTYLSCFAFQLQAEELKFTPALSAPGIVKISDQKTSSPAVFPVNLEVLSSSQAGFAASSIIPAEQTGSEILYWVVSSRHLPHDIKGCPQVPTFCLMKRKACGRLEHGTMQEFQAWLTPGEPVFLMAHGSFVDWKLSVKDAHGTYCWLSQVACGKPVKMVFWSWPSDGPYSNIPTIDVVHSGKRAAYDGIYLSYLIDCIPVCSPITMLGHSHGTRVIASALQFRAGGEIMDCCRGGTAPYRRIRIVFAAAAFDHHWLNPGNRYGCALTQVECFVNLINRHDAALVAYPLVVPFSTRSIARSGLTRRDIYLQGPLAYKTTEYDLTYEIGFRHTWPNYYQNQRLACLLSPYILNWGTAQQQKFSLETAK